MSAPQQPSFAPNEFLYWWLSRTTSPPPKDDHEQLRCELDATSPPLHPHVKRSGDIAKQKNMPHLPTQKPDQAHKSAHRHRHGHKPANGVAVPKARCLPHAGHPKTEKEDLEYQHRTKRSRSDRDVSGADPNGSVSLSPLWSYVRSRASSSHSGLSNRCQDAALRATRITAGERNPRNKYERRPRHKTRPDKYELKVDQGTVGKDAHQRTHRKSKRKNREMTGLVLNHDFRAPNTPQDRLTLKANSGPGMFHRGKASAPVERRGLPDLTFSEMNFLTKPRHTNVDRQQRQGDVVPSKKSNKGSAQEISDFFSKTEQHDVTLQGSQAKASSQRKTLTNQSISPNESSPARPCVRKPLSMILGNETGTRALSTKHLGAAVQPNAWVSDPRVPMGQHDHPAKIGSSVYRNQSNSIPSYDSWSATPRKSHPCADLHECSEACRLVSRELSHEPRPPSPLRRDLLKVTRRPSDQSSISDRSLEHYTKHVLLGEDKQSIWDCVPRAVSRGGHYSLQDLKSLARLSELGNVNRSSAFQSNQPRNAQSWEGIHIPLTTSDELDNVPPTHTSNDGAIEASTARPIASLPGEFIHRRKGADFMNAVSADPAAPGPQVAQSGRQGLFGAGPADHLSLRDSTRLGNIRFTPGRVAWLLSAGSPALQVRDRGTTFSNEVPTGNHPFGPFWRTFDSRDTLDIDHGFAESDTSVRYSENLLTAQAHIKESNGPFEPDKKLDHLQVQHEDDQHHDWIDHGTLQEIDLQDFKTVASDGHDEVDQYLLCGPAAFVENTESTVDDFGAAQPHSVFAETTTCRSDVRQDLTFLYDDPTPAARDYNRSNIEIGLKHSKMDVATSGLGIDGLQRNQTWRQSQRHEGGYHEVENGFMGFARPHILY